MDELTRKWVGSSDALDDGLSSINSQKPDHNYAQSCRDSCFLSNPHHYSSVTFPNISTPCTVNMRLIINGQTVKFKLSPEGTPLSLVDDKGRVSDYIIIKAKNNVLKKAEKKTLGELGIQDLESVGAGCYLCRFRPNDVTAVQGLGFIEGVAIYPPECKMSRALEKSIQRSDEKKEVRVILHSIRRKEDIEHTVMHVAEAVDLHKESINVDEASNYLNFEVKASMISKLVNLDSVKVIEEVLPKTINNDCARHILGLSYSDGQNLVGELPFQGEGQTVAVADTGLDLGDIHNMHPAFQGRVKELIAIGRPGNAGEPGRTDDPHGHGTHVCGSIVGASIPGSTYGHVKGTAPEAMLVMQSLLSKEGTLNVPSGTALARMLLDPFEDHGAHIHSNSWGEQWGGNRPIYDGDARIVDDCVHSNPDLLVCVAAGNTGNQSEGPTIGSLAACKNVLTVGATESCRPSFEGKALKDTSCENDPTEISWYSARGPTAEQRIKPDVLAPGTPILSTRSRALKLLPKNGLQESDDSNYAFAWGTSMATPLVAGCAAVLRESLVKNGTPEPPAALVKALLINGAYSFHHAHNSKEGFGIVNVPNSIITKSGKTGGFLLGKAFDDIDQEETTIIQVSGVRSQTLPSDDTTTGSIYTASRVTPPSRKGVTLKATLVYTDAPGAILQNNLHLQIKSADGRIRNGNRGTSQWFDNYNNVEQVIWKGITTGETTLIVRCQELTSDTQDYALVWKVISNED